MEIIHKHQLPVGDARARLEVLGEYLHNRHGIKVTWNGDKKLERKLERDFARAVAIAVEKCDWRGTFEVAVELKR